MAEVQLAPERILIVKEPKHYPESAAARFRTCRYASPLLEKAGLVVPRYISIPGLPTDRPMLAYWRIQLHTLREIWPDLSDRVKITVLRSYGAVIARLHSVRTKGWGSILPDDASPTLTAFLERDLGERLHPALSVEWPAATAALDDLIAAIPEIAHDGAEAGGVLNHNDLHMSNVLCEERPGDTPRCVGLLDLEAAVSMPAELDFARLLVYHGPLFGQPLQGCWFQRIWEGYGQPLDPRRLAFFKAYHLLNIGFHMSINGNGAHATQTLAAACEELGAFA
jgi:aminoglycoside phosphotransferase (APT) family kinase protein